VANIIYFFQCHYCCNFSRSLFLVLLSSNFAELDTHSFTSSCTLTPRSHPRLPFPSTPCQAAAAVMAAKAKAAAAAAASSSGLDAARQAGSEMAAEASEAVANAAGRAMSHASAEQVL
jgi:hypothetical protein